VEKCTIESLPIETEHAANTQHCSQPVAKTTPDDEVKIEKLLKLVTHKHSLQPFQKN
jgi:hypothetical protein